MNLFKFCGKLCIAVAALKLANKAIESMAEDLFKTLSENDDNDND